MFRHALIFWISVTLAVIGLVTGVMNYGLGSLSFLIFPLLLIGVLFYAYRIAPGRSPRGGGSKVKVKPSQKTMAKVAGLRKTQTPASGKRKTYPFQVIEGSKGKNDEQLPKYH
ncbi:hypothetical protein GCM10010912_22640 [Paenibacillus albidus]|uniref:DUF2207 domain-containing protein n=1 Tax=Paenibacillus albidus TaxID=2041023 RepID=A0A917C9C5_9BACL|nr:hypothetical protein [Paenibacillus albidus]GGF77011.1 hypothetical protein GCM10010912_22640 [Paenibacillus albidus]